MGNASALRSMIDTDRFDSMLICYDHMALIKKQTGTLIPFAKAKGGDNADEKP